MRAAFLAGVLLLSWAVSWAGEKPEQFRVWGGHAAPNAYLADPGAGAPAVLKPAPTKAEKSLGYTILSGQAFTPVKPGDPSATFPRCTGLSVADCPGQYGPLVFWIHAIQEGEYGIATKIELKHEDYDPVSGGRIPAAAPGTYDEWRTEIAAAIVRLSRE